MKFRVLEAFTLHVSSLTEGLMGLLEAGWWLCVRGRLGPGGLDIKRNAKGC